VKSSREKKARATSIRASPSTSPFAAGRVCARKRERATSSLSGTALAQGRRDASDGGGEEHERRRAGRSLKGSSRGRRMFLKAN